MGQEIAFYIINPFIDADGDTLTYTAEFDKNAAGSYAPLKDKWLEFYSEKLLLKGTPTSGEVNIKYHIKIIASDGHKTVEAIFLIDLGNKGPEVDGAHCAKLARLDDVVHLAEGWNEAAGVAGDEDVAGAFGRLAHGLGFFQVQGHGLLDDDVLAVLQRVDGVGRVEPVGRGDPDRLHVLVLAQGLDAVVGQTLRYMSFVQEELAEEGQTVWGAIIAHEDDKRIRRALTMTPSIAFYRYQVSFKLVEA